jgi:biotin transport system substrate-specific component
MFERHPFLSSPRGDFALKVIVSLGLLAGLGPLKMDLNEDLPITLQSLMVLWAAVAFGPRIGGLAVGLYLLLGLAGFPVFANHTGGWDKLSGPTGGYLFGFLLAALVIGWLAGSVTPKKTARHAGLWLGGHLLIVGLGLPWQMSFSGQSLLEMRPMLILLGKGAMVKSAFGMLLIALLHRSLSSRDEFYGKK